MSTTNVEMDCMTADDLDDPSCGYIHFRVSVNDLPLEGHRTDADKSMFQFEQFLFTIKQMREGGRRKVFFSCSSSPDYEWTLTAQMRIKAGHTSSDNLKVVDKDVFEFYPRCDPVVIEVMSDAVGIVKFELRVLNKLIEKLPKFEEGDLTVLFSDGSSVKVYRNLLALYSSYIQECTEGSDVTYVENFPKQAFLEMLYHIYPTLRPIYRNMKDYAKGAVSYQAKPLIYELSKHVVNYNVRSMTIEQKFKAALDLELVPAIEELVYRAAQDGVWSQLIKLGFEPESFFGAEIYRKIVCPAILAGRQSEYGTPIITKPYNEPDFFSQEAMQNPSNVTVLFRRTPFYINRGLMEAHGTSKFRLNSAGLYQAQFTREMEEECIREDLIPGEVMVSLFSSMYPLGPSVPRRSLRASIAFCHNHGWTHLKSQLEQKLLQQPPISWEEYRDQIMFAERFELQNMLSTSIQRSEASCNGFANELRNSDDFDLISPATRDLIVDRLCSGWGLEPKLVNKLGTREPTSFRERQIGLNCGGPREYDEERQVATLADMNSEYYFGPVGELCVVENA